MQQLLSRDADPDMEPGTKVEVRSRFEDSWVRGFEVAEVLDHRLYRLRRLSDGHVLPTDFREADLRPEKRPGMWWY
jgi:hypothetical protein